MKTYTVKQLAKLAHVSVRTLHHYDQIGLLKPARITENGYRHYQHDQLIQLMQVLFYRELDFSLEEIKRIMQDPQFNLTQALQDHKRLLHLKSKRIKRLLKTIDQLLDISQGEKTMNAPQTYKSFFDDEINKYKDEVKARWGHTDTYRQSMERYKSWSEADLKRIQEEGKSITLHIANAMDKSIDDPEVQDLIKQHHQHMSNFYDCTIEIYRGLGEMYVADPRFAATYNKVKPGLAEFLSKAINYYCDHSQG